MLTPDLDPPPRTLSSVSDGFQDHSGQHAVRTPERRPPSKISPALISAVMGATIASLLWIAYGRTIGKQPDLSSKGAPAAAAGVGDPSQPAVAGPVSQSAAAVARALPSQNLPAIPQHEPTATEERDGYVARLEHSGPASQTLEPIAHKLQGQWSVILRDVDAPSTVRMSPFKCFKAGCYLSLRHPAGFGFEQLASRFLEAKAFHEWPGPKFRSGPVVGSSGTVDITWIVFSPEDGEQATEQRAK